MILSIIVAMSRNRTIGKDNAMPWHLPADLKHFKTLTTGHPVVMGRKTYESIGRPLPNRTNIVVSRNEDLYAPGCQVAHSPHAAISEAQRLASPETFLIGGANLYAQMLPLAQKIYMTEIDADIVGDTFFPSWDASQWEAIDRVERPADEKNAYRLSFITYKRIS